MGSRFLITDFLDATAVHEATCCGFVLLTFLKLVQLKTTEYNQLIIQ